jgi:cytoskeletal protein CcmA (bactofilin family)
MVDIPRSGEEFATVIGGDAQFKGELTFQGGVRIDGTFEGAITTPGKVFVSKDGRLKAEVKAGTLVVEGQIEGNVVVKDRAELRATCRLTGDLKAAKLQVVEGATFVGRCEVGPSAVSGEVVGTADAAGMRPAVAVGPRR